MLHRSVVTGAIMVGRVVCLLAFFGGMTLADDLAPKADERQLPFAMHSAMGTWYTATSSSCSVVCVFSVSD